MALINLHAHRQSLRHPNMFYVRREGMHPAPLVRLQPAGEAVFHSRRRVLDQSGGTLGTGCGTLLEVAPWLQPRMRLFLQDSPSLGPMTSCLV